MPNLETPQFHGLLIDLERWMALSISLPELEQDDIAKVVKHRVEMMAKEPISFGFKEVATFGPGEEPFSILRRLIQIRDSIIAQGHDCSTLSTMIKGRVKVLIDLAKARHPGELILSYVWSCQLT